MWSDRTKVALGEKKMLKEKIRREVYVVYMLKRLLSKFEDKQTNSL